MGLEEVRLASGNPRDKFSFNERKKAWEQLEKAHRYNQGRFPNLPWGMDFYAGDMGRGKTLSCSREATAYYACGWEVYHAGSLLFGRMLQGTEVYTFPQQVEECIVVYFDEPQVWFESNVPQTIANRSVRQVVTTLRKMRCKMIFSTADEGGLLPIFRRETRTVYYPDRYYPGQQQRSRLDLEEEPRRLRYPPWCYVQLTPIGPHPWRRYTLADEYGVYGRRAASRKRKPIKIPPRDNWFAAKLYDSFERVQVAAGMRVTGAMVRGAMEDIDSQRNGYQELEAGLVAPGVGSAPPDSSVPVEPGPQLVHVGSYKVEEPVLLDWLNTLYDVVEDRDGLFAGLSPDLGPRDPKRGIKPSDVGYAVAEHGGPQLDAKIVSAIIGSTLGVPHYSQRRYERYALQQAVLNMDEEGDITDNPIG